MSLRAISPPPPSSTDRVIVLPDGAEASFDGRELALRDAEGRLVARWVDGALVLTAQGGRLRIEAGEIEIAGERGVSVSTPRLEVKAADTTAVVGRATVVGQHIETTARRLVHHAERYEVHATRLVETAEDAFREARDLLQQKAGRVRTLVAGVHTLFSQRNVMVSEKETKVDGSRILLG
jgi:hypothetical protein